MTWRLEKRSGGQFCDIVRMENKSPWSSESGGSTSPLPTSAPGMVTHLFIPVYFFEQNGTLKLDYVAVVGFTKKVGFRLKD